ICITPGSGLCGRRPTMIRICPSLARSCAMPLLFQLRRRDLLAILVTVCPLGWATARAEDAEPPARIDFNRQASPILSENCFACHGPDAKERKAELRLDTAEGASADHEWHQAVVPGKPEASELVRRILAADPGERMPPAESGKRLSAHQIASLRQWI